jgi:hypothetical protein
MSYTVIPAALILTLLLTFILSLFSKRPFRSFALFFLLLFLVSWSGQLWITPIGPVLWGIAWVPLIMISIFFSLLIFALIPTAAPPKKQDNTEVEDSPLIVFGVFFWIVLILLMISIIAGYYRSNYLV